MLLPAALQGCSSVGFTVTLGQFKNETMSAKDQQPEYHLVNQQSAMKNHG